MSSEFIIDYWKILYCQKYWFYYDYQILYLED